MSRKKLDQEPSRADSAAEHFLYQQIALVEDGEMSPAAIEKPKRNPNPEIDRPMSSILLSEFTRDLELANQLASEGLRTAALAAEDHHYLEEVRRLFSRVKEIAVFLQMTQNGQEDNESFLQLEKAVRLRARIRNVFLGSIAFPTLGGITLALGGIIDGNGTLVNLLAASVPLGLVGFLIDVHIDSMLSPYTREVGAKRRKIIEDEKTRLREYIEDARTRLEHNLKEFFQERIARSWLVTYDSYELADMLHIFTLLQTHIQEAYAGLENKLEYYFQSQEKGKPKNS